jgi:hypothetical protein
MVLGLALLAGCSDSKGPPRAVVSGQISFSGKPVKEGMIRFIPDNGPSAQAIISEGKFRIDQKGGVPVGPCKVELEAFEDTDKKTRTVSAIPEVREKEMRTSKQVLPDKYNTNTRLKFDVKADADNDFSMNLVP